MGTGGIFVAGVYVVRGIFFGGGAVAAADKLRRSDGRSPLLLLLPPTEEDILQCDRQNEESVVF